MFDRQNSIIVLRYRVLRYHIPRAKQKKNEALSARDLQLARELERIFVLKTIVS